MKSKLFFPAKFLNVIFIFALTAVFSPSVTAQEITSYQYRQVAPNKADEFIKRETTYWSKVARKAIDNGKLSFWGLFEKIGGNDLQNSPNFLFINTYPNIDSADNIWNASALFPNVPMAKMEDFSFSKVTSDLFLKNEGWAEVSKVEPEKDFKYIAIYYHNSSDPDSFITLEKKHWAPFIKSAMDKKQTAQRGWGNAVVLSPTGEDMKFNSISVDLFPSLKDALIPKWDSTLVFPVNGLTELNKLRIHRPSREIYRIVKVEAKESAN